MTETTSTTTVLTDGGPVPDGRSAHLPGDSHMWVMVLGDLVIFGGYFLIYMVHRVRTPDIASEWLQGHRWGLVL